MKNGKFTKEERRYLEALDAVEEVQPHCIIYSRQFKIDCMNRYFSGESPSKIFAEAGLHASLIGYKRIERAIYHWKEASAKGSLVDFDAPRISKKRHTTKIRCKRREKAERRKRVEERERERYRARIAELEAEVEALKGESALVKQHGRANKPLTKSEKFSLIEEIQRNKPGIEIKALCKYLEVSRSGYYKWLSSDAMRKTKEHTDLATKKVVEQAFSAHGFKKGSRQIRCYLLRECGIRMNRKKIQRIMRKYNIVFRKRRKNPYAGLAKDANPKYASNLLDRKFHQGVPRKVLLTDITYHKCLSGHCYTSALIDAETNEPLAFVTSDSLSEEFVLDTLEQLKGTAFAEGALIHSDQGTHYTALAFREKIAELGLLQSMSRRACCWDNASMESWFGRMKEQIGPTYNLSTKEVRDRVAEYVEYYRYNRGQARLGWLTPSEYAETLVA